jgi:hypothetical protein
MFRCYLGTACVSYLVNKSEMISTSVQQGAQIKIRQTQILMKKISIEILEVV